MKSPSLKVTGKCIIFFSCLVMMGNVFAQSEATPGQKSLSAPAEFPGSRQPLLEILDRIERNLGVSFAFQKRYLVGKYGVFRNLSSAELEVYLDEVLRSNGLKAKRIPDIEERIYIISPLENEPEKETAANQESNIDRESEKDQSVFLVYGSVTEMEEDRPIAGVNVLLKGTRDGTITDSKGNFVLEVPRGRDNTLVFSYIGYETQEYPALENSQMNVVMVENFQSLSEVVVTALGINRDQKSLGFAVSRVNGEQLVSTANTNIVSSLYGKAPGVRIRSAPGGATSAVTIQVRGLNSLNYSTQPLYVVDGVVIRDGNEKGAMGVNNEDYYTDQRIRGNGILDINSFDIESLTVLKGASASALYGSDASSGVVLITTKSGTKRQGLGMEVNYQWTQESVAFTPRYQNIYGPGYDRATNIALGADEEGFIPVDVDGDGQYDGKRPMFGAYAQFGPKMTGQDVFWWDGASRSFTPQPDNYKDFYRKGYSSAFNINLANQVAKWNYYISYTRRDYAGIQVGGKLERNTINLRTMLDVSDKLSMDLAVNYTNSYIHNRPMKINRLMSSWSGYFSRAEKMSLFFDKYQTSEGYKWVPYNQPQRNPEEALHFVTPRGYEVMDLLWRQLRDSENEFQDRVISSLTLNYDIHNNLRLRIRGGEDFTLPKTEIKEHNLYPTEFNGLTSTGSYQVVNGKYNLVYGDALISYAKQVHPRLNISSDAGVQVRSENYHSERISTNGGLVLENWFNFSNSFNSTLNTSQTSTSILKYAMLGVLKFDFDNSLFVEATGRQEYSSTLPPGNNSYFYPSVNSAFIFSDKINLPSFWNYGKFRLSYGQVGNAPPAYESNILYTFQNLQTSSGTVISATSSGSLYGNDNIRPEQKQEFEAGLESQLFNRGLAVDFAFYTSRTRDQIMKLSVPGSTGSERVLINGGELAAHGWELGLGFFPLRQSVVWNANFNLAYNVTRLSSLPDQVSRVVLRELEGNSIQVVAEEGETLGNIYVYPRKVDEQGRPVISEQGLYIIDHTRYEKVGNILPRFTGGFLNTFSWKNWAMMMNLDFSFGGQIISPPMKYALAGGQYENSLQYRDENYGGLPYYINDEGTKVLLPDHSTPAPDNRQVYHDGVLLDGVTEGGSANTTLIDAATYYINTFDWGNNAWNEKGAVFDNSYVKLREVLVSYTLPVNLAKRMRCNNIRFSLIGRNLFYPWRTLKDLDPESTIGSNWLNQGIDDGTGAATRSYGFSLEMKF